MGSLVDSTHSKYGKVRPYILYGSIPLAVCFFAMFAIPQGFSQTGKMVWATVFYVATGMLFTLVEVPSQTLLVRLTDDSSERMRLARAKSVIGTFGVILPPVVIPLIMEKVSNQWLAYAVSVGAFSVLIAVTYLMTFADTKERVELNDNSHIGLFQGLNALFANRYYPEIYHQLLRLRCCFRRDERRYDVLFCSTIPECHPDHHAGPDHDGGYVRCFDLWQKHQ